LEKTWKANIILEKTWKANIILEKTWKANIILVKTWKECTIHLGKVLENKKPANKKSLYNKLIIRSVARIVELGEIEAPSEQSKNN